MGGDRVDFFISHAGRERAWAEWVAWQLTDAGYSVELDVWDWTAGRNFVTAMSDALERAERVVALFSAAYFERERYTTAEWSSSLVHVPGLAEERLIPVRVEEVPADQVPPALRPLVYCDVFGVEQEVARRSLLKAVTALGRPEREPGFPGGRPGGLSRLGGAGPRRPGMLPRIWNVPTRNPGFTGRDGLLISVREKLLAGDRTVVQALHGMGGVGKTQLAAEYAHRFAAGYDLVWWIAAEQAGLIGEQVAALAGELSCAPLGADLVAAGRAVLAELRGRDRWLLVFDNAEDPEELMPWLPGGTGHVLITSRAHRWAEVAVPVEVDVLARMESVAILRDRVPALSAQDADSVADAVGDLPLAVAQAAGSMADMGMPAKEYTALLAVRAREILDQARPASYPQSLAALTQLALDRLNADDPAAAEVAALCAFLAPEPVPVDWFTRAAAGLSEPLASQAADPVAWRKVLARVGRNALARIDGDGLRMHRLTQAIVREYLSAGDAESIRAEAEAIVAASRPGDPNDPTAWPGWAGLLPHLVALDLAATSNEDLRDLACDAAWYLIRRGDARSGSDLAMRLYQKWREHYGPDDTHTLRAANHLAQALRDMGRNGEARELDEDTFARRRHVLGDDHTDTLTSASNLSFDLRALGDSRAARALDEDIVARRRRVLGDDHPDTLRSANNLGHDLRALGYFQAARELHEDIVARRRRVLGDDHPDTLWSANNLGRDLRALGDFQAARQLHEDTLARYRRVLGDDHPNTLNSANNLGRDLRGIGDFQAARDLHEDTVARYRRVLGDDHPNTLWSVNNLGLDFYALGELEAARDLHEDTLSRLRRVLGDEHPDTLAVANNLGSDLRALGDLQAARDLHEDTVARCRSILGDDHPHTLSCISNLGLDLYDMGEVEAARDLHEDTLTRQRRVLGDEHPDTLISATNLGRDLHTLSETRTIQTSDNKRNPY